MRFKPSSNVSDNEAIHLIHSEAAPRQKNMRQIYRRRPMPKCKSHFDMGVLL